MTQKERRNVREFGAVGDGIADDTAALQSALEAAQADGSHTVHVPAGVYRLRKSVDTRGGILQSLLNLFTKPTP